MLLIIPVSVTLPVKDSDTSSSLLFVRAEPQELADRVTEFLMGRGMNVERASSGGEGEIAVKGESTARSVATLFRGVAPQNVLCAIKEASDGFCELKIRFGMSGSFKRWAYWTLAAFMVCAIASTEICIGMMRNGRAVPLILLSGCLAIHLVAAGVVLWLYSRMSFKTAGVSEVCPYLQEIFSVRLAKTGNSQWVENMWFAAYAIGGFALAVSLPFVSLYRLEALNLILPLVLIIAAALGGIALAGRALEQFTVAIAAMGAMVIILTWSASVGAILVMGRDFVIPGNPLYGLTCRTMRSMVGAWGLVWMILTAISVLWLWRAILGFVAALDHRRNHPEFQPAISRTSYQLGRFIIITAWVLSSFVTVLSAVVGASAIEYCGLGYNPIFRLAIGKLLVEDSISLCGLVLPDLDPSTAQAAGKTTILFSVSPVVAWVVLGLWINISKSASTKALKPWRSTTAEKLARAEATIRDLVSAANIQKPILAIWIGDSLEASASLSALPWKRGRINITSSALETLPTEQLEALLAHEVGHLRHQHHTTLGTLTFLSRWSLCGEAFLHGLARDPLEMERDADKFACEWLEKKKPGGRKFLIALLETIEKERIRRILGNRNREQVQLAAAGGDWLPRDLRRLVSSYERDGICRRFSTALRLFFFLFFQGGSASYRHLPFSRRVKQIESLEL